MTEDICHCGFNRSSHPNQYCEEFNFIMTGEMAEARSLKFEASGTVNLRRLSSGRWALYPIGGVGTPFWIGPLEELEQAYNSRPPVQRHVYEPTAKKVAGLDINSLEIKL